MQTKRIYDWRTQTYRVVKVLESAPRPQRQVEQPQPERRPWQRHKPDCSEQIANYLEAVVMASTREIAEAIDEKVEDTLKTLNGNKELFESLGKHVTENIDGHGRQVVRMWRLTEHE